jgi:hypothetical protein
MRWRRQLELGVQLIEAIWAQDYERVQKIQVLLLQHNERIAPVREGLQNALRVISRINPKWRD